MARGFSTTLGSATTDRVETALTTHGSLRTYALKFVRNGSGGNNQGRLFDKRANGGTQTETCYYDAIANQLIFQRVWSGGAATWQTSGGGVTSTSTWIDLMITYDSGSTSNNPLIYVNGVSQSVSRTSAPSGSLVNNSDPYILGNLGAASRVFDGMIAEFAVWDQIQPVEIAAALAAGYSPLFFQLNQVEHVPLLRDNISRKLAAPTITGTAVQPHSRLIYPRNLRQMPLSSNSLGKISDYYRRLRAA